MHTNNFFRSVSNTEDASTKLQNGDTLDVDLGEVPAAVKQAQRQAIGLSSYLGAIRNIPGLVNVGDFLGVNGDFSTQSFQLSQSIGMGLLAGVLLAVYALGPMIVPVLLIAAGVGLLAKHLTQSTTHAIGIAVMVFITIAPQMINISSDKQEQLQVLTQLVMATSGEIQAARIQNAKSVAAAMEARNASDAASAGAIGGAVAGIAAGIYTGGNPMAISAAANAGTGLMSAAYKGAGDRAVHAKLQEISTYFGEYV